MASWERDLGARSALAVGLGLGGRGGYKGLACGGARRRYYVLLCFARLDSALDNLVRGAWTLRARLRPVPHLVALRLVVCGEPSTVARRGPERKNFVALEKEG